MKKLISFLFVVLCLYSCSDISNEDPKNCGSVSNVVYERFNYCGTLKENPKQISFLILNSEEELKKLFTLCEDVGSLPDFTKKRVLALFAGPKPTGGYDIKIQSVRQDNCQIVVEYYEREPKPDEYVTMATTYPADYVVLPTSDKPILFVKVKPVDYVVVGSFYGSCVGAECQQFFRIENQKVLHYLNVNYDSYDFGQYSYTTLGYKEDFAAFLLKVPTEIKNLKGQTKTFGAPDSHDQGGVYFEWRQDGVVTKVFLDNDNSEDQTQNIVNFKKVIQDKITELKTKQ